MADRAVTIRCEAKTSLAIEDLREFQGGLKSLSDANYSKLRAQILTRGFSFPLFVWQSDGSNYLLDGHQRLKTLRRLRDEGYEVPDVPVAIVEAASYKEAKEKLLAAASQYGEVEKQGLFDFLIDSKIEPDYLLENMRLPEIEFEAFKLEYFPEPAQPEAMPEPDREPTYTEFKHAEPGQAELIHGDCLDVLRNMGDASVDAMVTDPPAGISFMGKGWDDDKGGRDEWIAWMAEVMREALRVLKPGAHGLVWALPRTSHWTATALENAGFEVRDIILHLFSSGFPKSMDVGKAIDKAAGAEREVIGFNPNHRVDMDTHVGFWSANKRQPHTGDGSITASATPEAKHWEGWGTALKPAAENYILIRKPLSEKTVAANVLEHGTGAINIDGSRVGADGGKAIVTGGRFPANLVLSHNEDCEQVGTREVKSDSHHSYQRSGGDFIDGKETIPDYRCTPGCAVRELDLQSGGIKDTCGASRFFYSAKPARSDKGEANTHPTVKSVELMSYFVRMITPPGGTVLDCFMGSGTTGVAAIQHGFRFIGIEREAEYFAIASRRINGEIPKENA